jgi:MFS family permease
VLVLDTTAMNVSVPVLVEDLGTTVVGIQLAISLFTLVMAAAMITGGRVGRVIGPARAFRIGMVVYGVGSAITAAAPNLWVLIVGWSVIEGLGAALVTPAIAAIIARGYRGQARAGAFALVGAVAASGAAAGPILGGLLTTYASWRWLFVGEVAISAVVALLARTLPADEPVRERGIDLVGAALSAAGMVAIVLGVLGAGSWGWIIPSRPPEIAGHVIAPLGISPTVWLILAGIGVLYLLLVWERHRQSAGKTVLIDPTMLSNRQLTGGLVTIGITQLFMSGTLFAVPLYLGIVLGRNAFETGLQLLPLSIAVIVFSQIGARLSRTRSPRTIAGAGFAIAAVGPLILAGVVDRGGSSMLVGMAVFGSGIGLTISQLANTILSAVPPEQGSQAGGLQSTAVNLGASLGTALMGAVVVAGLAASIGTGLDASTRLPPAVREQAKIQVAGGVSIVPTDVLRRGLETAGVGPGDSAELVRIYEQARKDALRRALILASGFALLGLVATRRLPATPLAAED